jgi:hypothetical protein
MWTCEMVFIKVKIQIQAPKRVIWEYTMKQTHYKDKIKLKLVIKLHRIH